MRRVIVAVLAALLGTGCSPAQAIMPGGCLYTEATRKELPQRTPEQHRAFMAETIAALLAEVRAAHEERKIK